jgi:hypothetical protein
MIDAKRDDNYNAVLMGVSSADGVTPIPLTVDPDTGRLRVYVAGTSLLNAIPDRNTSRRDDNRKPVLAGENNTTDAYEPFSIETANNGLMLLGG